ncbi:hypothetical protein H9P43_004451 [Blastocladiella emersonii ATCC 22665]|nr:hypothetical protein H9P43_004451 [Blastocladiella emersonii ATCC 22665]
MEQRDYASGSRDSACALNDAPPLPAVGPSRHEAAMAHLLDVYAEAPMATHAAVIDALEAEAAALVDDLLADCGAWIVVQSRRLREAIVDALDPDMHHPLFHFSVGLLVRIATAFPAVEDEIARQAGGNGPPELPRAFIAPDILHSRASTLDGGELTVAQLRSPDDVEATERRVSAAVAALLARAAQLLVRVDCFHAALRATYALVDLDSAILTPRVQALLLEAFVYWNPLRPHLAVPHRDTVTSANGSCMVGLDAALAHEHLLVLLVTVVDRFQWRQLSLDALFLAPTILVDALLERACATGDVDALLHLLSWDPHVQVYVLDGLLAIGNDPVPLPPDATETTQWAGHFILAHPKVIAWLAVCGMRAEKTLLLPPAVPDDDAESLRRERAAQLLLGTRSRPWPFRCKLAVLEIAIRASLPSAIVVPLMSVLEAATPTDQPVALAAAIVSLHHPDREVRQRAARWVGLLSAHALTKETAAQLVDVFTQPTATGPAAFAPPVGWADLEDMRPHLAALLGDLDSTVADATKLATLVLLSTHPQYAEIIAGKSDALVDRFLAAADADRLAHLAEIIANLFRSPRAGPVIRRAVLDPRVLDHMVSLLVLPATSPRALRLRGVLAGMFLPERLPAADDDEAWRGSADVSVWTSGALVQQLVERWWTKYGAPLLQPESLGAVASHDDLVALVHRLRLVSVHAGTHAMAAREAKGLARFLAITPAGEDDMACQALVLRFIATLVGAREDEEIVAVVLESLETVLAPFVLDLPPAEAAIDLAHAMTVFLTPLPLSIASRYPNLLGALGRALRLVDQCGTRAAHLLPAVLACFVPNPDRPPWLIARSVRVLAETQDPSRQLVRDAYQLLLTSSVVDDPAAKTSAGEHENLESWLDPGSGSLHWLSQLAAVCPDLGWTLTAHLARFPILAPEIRAAFAGNDPVACAIAALDVRVSDAPWLFLEVATARNPGPMANRLKRWGGWGTQVVRALAESGVQVQAAVVTVVATAAAEDADLLDFGGPEGIELVQVVLRAAAWQGSLPVESRGPDVAELHVRAATTAFLALERDMNWSVLLRDDLVGFFDVADVTSELALLVCTILAAAPDHVEDLIPAFVRWLPSLAAPLPAYPAVLVHVQLLAHVLRALLVHHVPAGPVSLAPLAPQLSALLSDPHHLDLDEQQLVCHALGALYAMVAFDPSPIVGKLLGARVTSAQPASSLPSPGMLHLLTAFAAQDRTVLHNDVVRGWMSAAMSGSPGIRPDAAAAVLALVPCAVRDNRDAQAFAGIAERALAAMQRDPNPMLARTLAYLLAFPATRQRVSASRTHANPVLALLRLLETRTRVPVKTAAAVAGVDALLTVLAAWSAFPEAQARIAPGLPVLVDVATNATLPARLRTLALRVLRNAAYMRENKARMSDADMVAQLIQPPLVPPGHHRRNEEPAARLGVTLTWLAALWVLLHANHRPLVVRARPALGDALAQVRAEVEADAGVAAWPTETDEGVVSDARVDAGEVSASDVLSLIHRVERVLQVSAGERA